ncbi:MAG: PAS domain S-box protein [Acidobacteria bacterium]|nr:PAS domain S-box protein [Acidobacteriota bacterium]
MPLTSVAPKINDAPAWRRYGVATLAVLGAAGLRLALGVVVDNIAPYLLFGLAIVIASYYGGHIPGLVATGQSLLVSWLFFLEPRFGLAIRDKTELVNLLLLAAVGAAISWLSGRVTRSRASAQSVETRFQALTGTIPQLVWTAADDGQWRFHNSRYVDYIGDRQWLDACHEDDRPGVQALWDKAVQTGAPFRAQCRLRRASDHLFRWFDVEAHSVASPAAHGVKWMAAATDVHDQRETLDQLRAERDRLDLIIASAPAALCAFRMAPDGSLAMPFASARLSDIYGVDPALLATNLEALFERIHPEDARKVRDAFQRSAETMSPWLEEYRVRRTPEDEIWVESRSIPSREPDGGVRWYSFAADITSRKRIQQAARDAEDRLLFALEASNTGYWEVDLATGVSSGSRRHGMIFGYPGPAPDWSFEHFLSFVVPEDRAMVALRQGVYQEDFECRIRRLDGEERWIAVSRRVAPSTATGPASLVGIVRDITDLKRAEAAIRREADRELAILRVMVEDAPVGLVMLDRAMRHVRVSRRWMQDAGVTAEQVLGKTHSEVFPDLPASWLDAIRRGLAGERLSRTGECYTDKDGRERWVNWEIHPWGDDGVETGGVIIYVDDFTERRRTENAARRLDLEYRALFENLSQGLAYCRIVYEDGVAVDWKYLRVNQAFEALTGLKGISGMRVSDAIPGFMVSGRPLLDRYARVAETGVQEQFEVQIEALDEWFSVSAYSPERGYFVAVFEVITERRRAEEELRESRRRLQLALEIAELGFVEYDPTGDVMSASDRFRAIFGLGEHPSLADATARIHPDDRPSLLPWTERLKGDVESWQSEYRLLLPDGGVRWIAARGALHRHGNSLRMLGVARDITRERTAERALRRNEALYRAIARTIPEAGIWVVDPSLRMVAAEGELSGLFGVEGIRGAGERFKKALAGETDSFETQVGDRTLWVRDRPVLDDSGEIAFAMELALDITTRKLAEQRIQNLNVELEERVRQRTSELETANAELEAFTYSVSHDLRAPLRGIDGWSLALMEDYGAGLDERATQYLGRVRTEAQRMGRLIDGLLRLSRIVRGDMTIRPVDMSALANRVAGRLVEAHPDRRIEFVIEPGLAAIGDAGMLDIALTNLFDNAVKFTGKREVAVISLGRSNEPDGARFFVRDNGAGFDMEFAGLLFGAFQRLHSQAEFPGTGIGLATVQRVVRRHGGNIRASSEPEKGAIFSFVLERSS